MYQFPPLPILPELLRGKSFTVVQAAYLGGERDGAEIMRPLTELGPHMNTFGMVEPAALGHLAMDPAQPLPYASSARIVSDASARDLIDAFLDPRPGPARRHSWPPSSCGRWAVPWRGAPRAPARGRRSRATTSCSPSAA